MNDALDCISELPVQMCSQRVASTDVELALLSHPDVVEAVVTPMTIDIAGQTLCAFVRLKEGTEESEQLKAELIRRILSQVGPVALLQRILFAPVLPRTRSGKIMRGVLDTLALEQA